MKIINGYIGELRPRDARALGVPGLEILEYPNMGDFQDVYDRSIETIQREHAATMEDDVRRGVIPPLVQVIGAIRRERTIRHMHDTIQAAGLSSNLDTVKHWL